MTLLTHQVDAGWREVEAGAKFAAEKLISLPGATASNIRVEAESLHGLIKAVSLREGQLAGRLETPRDVITNDGSTVTDAQHQALQAPGVSLSSSAEDVSAAHDEMVAAKDAEIDSLNEQLVAAHDVLAASPTTEAVAAKDKEIEDLKSELAAANEALSNALKDVPADPHEAPATEQPTEDSSSSSEAISSTEEVSPVSISTEPQNSGSPMPESESPAPITDSSTESPADDESLAQPVEGDVTGDTPGAADDSAA